MKSPLIPILGLLFTAALCFVLGRATAPFVPAPSAEVLESHRKKSSVPTAVPDESPRVRSKDRGETQPSKEPRISLPLPIVVKRLKKDLFSKDFTTLEPAMEESLPLLGATPREIEEIKALLATAKTRIQEEEQRHIKVVDVTPGSIRLDASAMQRPAEEAATALKGGIRATLPAVEAEALVSTIDWGRFYQIERSTASFEILRGKDGGLMAQRRGDANDWSSGSGVGPFKDDGTPIPADQIFDDRWKPFLKGLTLLPVDAK